MIQEPQERGSVKRAPPDLSVNELNAQINIAACVAYTEFNVPSVAN